MFRIPIRLTAPIAATTIAAAAPPGAPTVPDRADAGARCPECS